MTGFRFRPEWFDRPALRRQGAIVVDRGNDLTALDASAWKRYVAEICGGGERRQDCQPDKEASVMVSPTAEELAAARDRVIPDVVGPGLRVLFCGINPGLWSGALGQHFARPGNRFWPALHRSGFTPRQLRPEEQQELLSYGLGVTNLAPRTTARADELTRDELTAGSERLAGLAERCRPRWVAVVGVTAYRIGFGRPKARVGRQEEWLGGSGLWVLPNPSGLNAHYQLAALAEEFAKLRRAADSG